MRRNATSVRDTASTPPDIGAARPALAGPLALNSLGEVAVPVVYLNDLYGDTLVVDGRTWEVEQLSATDGLDSLALAPGHRAALLDAAAGR